MLFCKTSPILTDLYELTMAQIYFKKELCEEAVFEVHVRTLPPKRGYILYAGLEPALQFLKNAKFDDEDLDYLDSLKIFEKQFLDYLRDLKFEGKVYSIPEGTVATHKMPLFSIKASLPTAQVFESALLNIITFETLIATKASRLRGVAKDKLLVDFSLRRVHGLEAGFHVARASYIGGFDGTSNVYAGEKLRIPIYGTMAHSYVLAFGDEKEAFEKYYEKYGENSVFLIDTFDIQKGLDNAIEVAQRMEREGRKLKGIRIDSGNLVIESKKVRRKLNESGMEYVKIMLSGSLDEYQIECLLQKKAPVDAFGVGTKLGVSSDVPYLDTAYKLVEYRGKGMMKTSAEKETLPFLKSVRRKVGKERWLYEIGMRGEFEEEMLREIDLTQSSDDIKEIKKRAEKELGDLPERYRDIHNPEVLEIMISATLEREKEWIRREFLR